MPQAVDRDQVRALVARGARLVEVLPQKEYDDEHLPGSVNVPLRELTREAADRLRGEPIVVYCWDGA